MGGQEENPRVSSGMRERSKEHRGNTGTLDGMPGEHRNAMDSLG